MIKLIIADDEKSTRQGLLDYLPWKELGVDVVAEAEDGKKALELALTMKPDIVLTDIRMPQMNGIDFANRLRESLPQCKIIFLSGYTDKEYLKSAIHLQAVSYIEKPVDLDEVCEVFKKTVAACKEELEKKTLEANLKSTVLENISLIREKLVLELASSHMSVELLSDKFRYVEDCDFHKDHFISTIISMKYDEGEAFYSSPAFREELVQKVEAALGSHSFKFMWGYKSNTHLLLHIYGSSTFNHLDLNTAFQKLLEDVKSSFHDAVKPFIALGKAVLGAENIPVSYQTLVLALQKQFFLGYEKIYFYKESCSPPYIFDEKKLKEFSDLIIKEKKNEAIAFIRNIAMDLRCCENTLVNNVKDFFFKIMLSLSNIAENMGIHIIEQDNKQEFLWNIISKTDTLDEIGDYITGKIAFLFQYKEQRETSGTAVFNAMKYIQGNYGDESLSIKAIADYAFLTPNYLCLVFKKETGKTINQYITEIRVEKAKEHLKDKRIKLYDVANRVGFSDANYFAKTFKKIVGLNPSEYREKYLS